MAEITVLFNEVQHFRQLFLWLTLVPVVLLLLGIGSNLLFRHFVPVQTIDNAEPPPRQTKNAISGVVLILLGILIPALVYTANLTTTVGPDNLTIQFFPFHLSPQIISLENLERVEAVTYSPMADYGGWGIRSGGKGKAYNVSGDQGVKLFFTDGTPLLIGSQQPEELAAAITKLQQR